MLRERLELYSLLSCGSVIAEMNFKIALKDFKLIILFYFFKT